MSEIKQLDNKSLRKQLIKKVCRFGMWTIAVTFLLYIGWINYNLFHIGIELYTVIVAFIAYIIVMNTYEISQNSFFTFLGMAFGFVGILDLVHLLTSRGLEVFGFIDINISLQTWIAARILQSTVIILSFIFIKRRIRKTVINSAFLIITLSILSVILYTNIIPACYTPRNDATIFRIACAYLCVFLLLIGMYLLLRHKSRIRYRVYRNLLLSLGVGITGQLLMAFYGYANNIMIVGGVLKLIAYYYFYSAVIVTTLKSPINVMYYELDRVRDELAEKNLEVIRANEQLKQEVSDLQMIEKLLRRSKAWSRAIFEGSSIGIVLLNLNGVIIEVNPAFERIIGYSTEELRDLGIRNITHPDDYEHDEILYSELIGGNIENYNIEKRYIHKDGRIIWGNLEMSYIQNEGEDFRFLIAMIEDITERKQNQDSQRQLLKELGNINQELDSFAYIVSHDLKAPLRGIGSLAGWLSNDYSDKLDEEGKEIINLMINRVERMKSFIDGILQYSRVAKTGESKVDIDLNKVVNEVIELMSPSDNISIIIENKLPIIKTYRIYMEQIFQNLISNSIKFMDKPYGIIKIKAYEADGFWEISINDNGPGIDERYHNKIFQIFQTLQPRDKFESTGIGLSIVKKIVETNGGSIWIESELGAGSTFYFTLPKDYINRN